MLEKYLGQAEDYNYEQWERVGLRTHIFSADKHQEDMALLSNHLYDRCPLIDEYLSVSYHPESITNQEIWSILGYLDKVLEYFISHGSWQAVVSGNHKSLNSPLNCEVEHSNWEQERNTNSIGKCHKQYVQVLCISQIDIEVRATMCCFISHHCVLAGLVVVYFATSTLVQLFAEYAQKVDCYRSYRQKNTVSDHQVCDFDTNSLIPADGVAHSLHEFSIHNVGKDACVEVQRNKGPNQFGLVGFTECRVLLQVNQEVDKHFQNIVEYDD